MIVYSLLASVKKLFRRPVRRALGDVNSRVNFKHLVDKFIDVMRLRRTLAYTMLLTPSIEPTNLA